MDIPSCERALVEAFIIPSKRARYATLLAKPTRRAKILDGLNHNRDFDPRYATPVPSTTDIVAALRAYGAPNRCHVLSSLSELDGQEMDLADAIDEAESGLIGTLIGCIPGKLAYYYDEGGAERVILKRS